MSVEIRLHVENSAAQQRVEWVIYEHNMTFAGRALDDFLVS